MSREGSDQCMHGARTLIHARMARMPHPSMHGLQAASMHAWRAVRMHGTQTTPM